eukprot:1698849-Amphidinium_carterae.1
MVITGRRARLEAAQREAIRGNRQDGDRPPKAPPTRIQEPKKVQRDEERQRLNARGYYVTPPAPNHQRDKEQLAKLEEEEEERQRRIALSTQEAEEERQRLQAYVERLEAEAAQQGIPEKVIAQVQQVQVEVPEIGALPEVVNSSTSGSTSGQTSSKSLNTGRRQQQVEDAEDTTGNTSIST